MFVGFVDSVRSDEQREATDPKSIQALFIHRLQSPPGENELSQQTSDKSKILRDDNCMLGNKISLYGHFSGTKKQRSWARGNELARREQRHRPLHT